MIDLLNWKRKFINSEIMDGTCWSIEIFKNKKSIRIQGVNDYPKEWELFCKLIKDVSGKPFEQGSGLKRIKETFKDEKLVEFYSNESSFYVVMKK